jgi:predicted nucleic acid-binding protein
MIAADTSSLSNFLKKEGTADADLVRKALVDGNLILSPVVVSELFSSPKMTEALKAAIRDIPVLDLKPGFWERVGFSRATILKAGKKARLADSMIATCCLDHDIPMIARDSDFRHFTEHFGLVVHSGITG